MTECTIKLVRKRDGRLVQFDQEKITQAIFKAAQAVGGDDLERAVFVSNSVVALIQTDFGPSGIPSVEEIQDLGKLQGQEINRAKEILAYELTKIVHGDVEADGARAAAKVVFSGGNATDGDPGDAIAGGAGAGESVPSIAIDGAEFAGGIPVLELFARTDLCSSRSDARRLVTQGGASINERKVTDIGAVVDEGWLEDDQLLLRAGKKRYFRVTRK